MSNVTLHTPRLRLRLLDTRPADAKLYRALYTCPRVMAAIMPPLDEAAADAAFVRVCRHNGLDTPGHRFWVIEDRVSSQGLGLTALQRCGARAEFGVMVLADHWKRRIASEALGTVLVHAFEHAGLEWVDGCRADDAHATVIDRLFGPFGFERVADSNVPGGKCHWTLSHARWRSHAGRPVDAF